MTLFGGFRTRSLSCSLNLFIMVGTTCPYHDEQNDVVLKRNKKKKKIKIL